MRGLSASGSFCYLIGQRRPWASRRDRGRRCLARTGLSAKVRFQLTFADKPAHSAGQMRGAAASGSSVNVILLRRLRALHRESCCEHNDRPGRPWLRLRSRGLPGLGKPLSLNPATKAFHIVPAFVPCIMPAGAKTTARNGKRWFSPRPWKNFLPNRLRSFPT